VVRDRRQAARPRRILFSTEKYAGPGPRLGDISDGRAWSEAMRMQLTIGNLT
jgi:hypothetical protein